jgi:hypothetical protein
MYVTGTISSFASRLHQLPSFTTATGLTFRHSGIWSVNQFIIEGKSYIASGWVSAGLSGQWEREARNQRYRMSGDARAMLVQMF